MRSLGLAVVVAALLGTGCGHHEREVSAADRKLCANAAGSVAAPGSERYRGIVDECVHNLQHPERGGG